ncbi:MAG: TldD/PmbA family protein [Gemmatimonadota bacterium]
MREPTYLTEAEARGLAERALGFATADQTRVNIRSGTESNTRFAVNQITTTGDVHNASLAVTSAFGQRVGSATTNRFDDESLRRVVDTSERIARLAPEDPEYLGELGAQTYTRQIEPWFDATANLDAEARATAVRQVTEEAQRRGLVSTGFLPVRAGSEAVATSRGLFAYERATGAAFTTTVRTPDGTGSGWAGTGVHDWGNADVSALAARAIEKAEMSRNPQPIEPGRWTVILEPEAVGSLVAFIFNQLAARSADEGRSFFAEPANGTRIGERLIDERVTLWSDPNDPLLFTAPFNSEGLPNRRMVWFDRGTLRQLVYDRYWAQRQNRPVTGFPAGFRMSGGDATMDEMIASTERGLLVTRLWYMRSVDTRQILYTGLTRDGTFLIENGRITRPVQNLRWNESPMHVLNNVEMMGSPERVLASESGSVSSAVVVPALKVRDFNFTSISEAV